MHPFARASARGRDGVEVGAQGGPDGVGVPGGAVVDPGQRPPVLHVGRLDSDISDFNSEAVKRLLHVFEPFRNMAVMLMNCFDSHNGNIRLNVP